MNQSSFRFTAVLLASTIATSNCLMMAPLVTRFNAWGIQNLNQSPANFAQEFANGYEDSVVDKPTAPASTGFDGSAAFDDYKKELLQTVYERTMERSFHTEDNCSYSRRCWLWFHFSSRPWKQCDTSDTVQCVARNRITVSMDAARFINMCIFKSRRRK